MGKVSGQNTAASRPFPSPMEDELRSRQARRTNNKNPARHVGAPDQFVTTFYALRRARHP